MNTSQNLPLPSPRELAKKSSTRSVSLRVNEQTLIAFEKYASIYDTTTSALINNLLDAYVERFSISENKTKEAARRVMRSRLFKKYMSIRRHSIEELENEPTIVASAGDFVFTKLSDLSGGYQGIDFCNGDIFFRSADRISEKADINHSYVKEEDGRLIIFVPDKMWYVVCAMLIEYKNTFKLLCETKKSDFVISIKAAREISDRINKVIGRPDEMAHSMVGILSTDFSELAIAGKIFATNLDEGRTLHE